MPIYLLRRLGRLLLLALPAMLLFSSCATTKYYNQRTLFRLTDKQGRQLDSTKLRIAVNRELDALALFQVLEAFALDRREVDKDICAVIASDETVTLGSIEPLNGSDVAF